MNVGWRWHRIPKGGNDGNCWGTSGSPASPGKKTLVCQLNCCGTGRGPSSGYYWPPGYAVCCYWVGRDCVFLGGRRAEHSRQVMLTESGYLSEGFTRSLLMSSPAQWLAPYHWTGIPVAVCGVRADGELAERVSLSGKCSCRELDDWRIWFLCPSWETICWRRFMWRWPFIRDYSGASNRCPVCYGAVGGHGGEGFNRRDLRRYGCRVWIQFCVSPRQRFVKSAFLFRCMIYLSWPGLPFYPNLVLLPAALLFRACGGSGYRVIWKYFIGVGRETHNTWFCGLLSAEQAVWGRASVVWWGYPALIDGLMSVSKVNKVAGCLVVMSCQPHWPAVQLVRRYHLRFYRCAWSDYPPVSKACSECILDKQMVLLSVSGLTACRLCHDLSPNNYDGQSLVLLSRFKRISEPEQIALLPVMRLYRSGTDNPVLWQILVCPSATSLLEAASQYPA